jgi:hypothetical protein
MRCSSNVESHDVYAVHMQVDKCTPVPQTYDRFVTAVAVQDLINAYQRLCNQPRTAAVAEATRAHNVFELLHSSSDEFNDLSQCQHPPRTHAHTQLSPASRWSLVAIGITAPRTPCCDPLGAKHEIITGVHLSIEACWHLQHTRRPALHALPGCTALHTMATTEQAPQAPYAPHPACPASTWLTSADVRSSTALSAMRWCSIASMAALRSLCSRATSGPCAAGPPQPRRSAAEPRTTRTRPEPGAPAWAHTCMGTHAQNGRSCCLCSAPPSNGMPGM